MLHSDKVTFGYKNFKIIRDISLTIERSKIYAIIGPNGSGKSTLLKNLARILHPQSGVVSLDTIPFNKIPVNEFAKKIAILSQIHNVPEDFTARDLISFGRYPHLGWFGRLAKEDDEIVDWAVHVMRIGYFQHRNITVLSGGERQRVWIAMALAQKTAMLLLDEPTTFLDIAHQFEILELIRKLNKNFNLGIVMVLHDLNQAARYAERIIVIKDGLLYREGTPDEIITEQTLGDVFRMRVRIVRDEMHHCPYFIPMESLD